MTSIKHNASQLRRLDRDELLAALRVSEAQRRRHEARHLELLREIESRNVKVTWGYSSLGALIGVVCNASRKEANRLTKLTTAVANIPAAGSALASAQISTEHVTVMETFRRSLPACTPAKEWVAAVPTLVELASIWRPARLARFANTELRLRFAARGGKDTVRDQPKPRNRLSIRRQPDGWYRFEGLLEPQSGARWDAELKNPARRRASTESVGPDKRSPAERRGDAFEEWITDRSADTSAGTQRIDRPYLIVTIDWDNLRSGMGPAVLGPDQSPISITEARRIACDSTILPALLGGRSALLDLGQPTESVRRAVRQAVAIRDRHCAFPGCERAAPVCELHHVVAWQHGGPGTPENLTLLCGAHHRLVHEGDWVVRMSQGVPEFVPPSCVDPTRAPRVNRAPD